MKRVLLIDPWHGGSHAHWSLALADGLRPDTHVELLPFPARHWKWRMRGSGAWAASVIESRGPGAPRPDVIITTAMLPLADLIACAPSLRGARTLLMFHDNQFAYPQQPGQERERDHHFAFTQLLSARVADHCVFNSHYNRDTFLAGGRELLGRLPDRVPSGWIASIEAASSVIGIPVPAFPEAPAPRGEASSSLRQPGPPDDPAAPRGEACSPVAEEAPAWSVPPGPPLLVWNHRWEHDKGPEVFAALVDALDEAGLSFRVALLGERYRRVPDAFARLQERHASRIVAQGPASRTAYAAWLRAATVVVSTARHEFFGVSMIEAAKAGAAVLVPDALVYPELFGEVSRYATFATLVARTHRWIAAAGAWDAPDAQRAAVHDAMRDDASSGTAPSPAIAPDGWVTASDPTHVVDAWRRLVDGSTPLTTGGRAKAQSDEQGEGVRIRVGAADVQGPCGKVER